MKVTFLTVMPSPYVQDLFAVLAADARIDLRVLYLEQEAPDTYWGPQLLPDYAQVLPGRWFGIGSARIHVNPTAIRVIRALDADLVVVVGYIGLTNQAVMRWLNYHQKRWVFWGEIPGFVQRGRFGRFIRSQLQAPLRKAQGIAAVGSHAVTAYRELLTGSFQGPIVNIPYHCQIEPFREAATRRQHSERIRFLFCGQLIDRKGVDVLCAAFGRLIHEGGNAELTLVGTGPLHDELLASLSESVRQRVRFAGFQPVNELPNLFSQSDVFVLPSRHDGWGVVVNQAVGAGMPIIATAAVGASHDLVEPERNGFRIPPDSVDDLHRALAFFVNRPERVAVFGKVSSELSRKIDVRTSADDWWTLFSRCVSCP